MSNQSLPEWLQRFRQKREKLPENTPPQVFECATPNGVRYRVIMQPDSKVSGKVFVYYRELASGDECLLVNVWFTARRGEPMNLMVMDHDARYFSTPDVNRFVQSIKRDPKQFIPTLRMAVEQFVDRTAFPDFDARKPIDP